MSAVCVAGIHYGAEIGSTTSVKLQYQFQSPKDVRGTFMFFCKAIIGRDVNTVKLLLNAGSQINAGLQ